MDTLYMPGKVKSALIRWEIPDAIDLLGAAIEILNGFSEA
jgi:hypothetical protein